MAPNEIIMQIVQIIFSLWVGDILNISLPLLEGAGQTDIIDDFLAETDENV